MASLRGGDLETVDQRADLFELHRVAVDAEKRNGVSTGWLAHGNDTWDRDL